MAASKTRNKRGEKHEKERRQPSGPNRRPWWQAKATTSREKNMRRKGVSPEDQIDPNGGKQKSQQAGRKACEGKAPAPMDQIGENHNKQGE